MGFLDQCIFGKALLIKSLWRAMWGNWIWRYIFKHKYLNACDLEHIYRDTNISLSRGLLIWRFFHKVWEYWRLRVVWGFGNGHKIFIGLDPIKGVSYGSTLSMHTLSMRQCGGFFYLSQIINIWEAGFPIWKNVVEMHLMGNRAMKWNSHVKNLSSMRLCFDRGGDCLHQIGRLEKGAPIVDDRYKWLMAQNETQGEDRGFPEYGNGRFPKKICHLPNRFGEIRSSCGIICGKGDIWGRVYVFFVWNTLNQHNISSSCVLSQIESGIFLLLPFNSLTGG